MYVLRMSTRSSPMLATVQSCVVVFRISLPLTFELIDNKPTITTTQIITSQLYLLQFRGCTWRCAIRVPQMSCCIGYLKEQETILTEIYATDTRYPQEEHGTKLPAMMWFFLCLNLSLICAEHNFHYGQKVILLKLNWFIYIHVYIVQSYRYVNFWAPLTRTLRIHTVTVDPHDHLSGQFRSQADCPDIRISG